MIAKRRVGDVRPTAGARTCGDQDVQVTITVVIALGGSTNAVLHFLAIAHAAEVDWTIDDFERIRRRTPVLCDLKPSGRYLAIDLHRAGGIPAVAFGPGDIAQAHTRDEFIRESDLRDGAAVNVTSVENE